MAAEQIYDALVQLSPYQKERLQRQFQPDIVENPQKPVDPHKLINTVVAAVHSATLNKKAGDIPGEVQQTLKKFLKPKLPWRQLLQQFLTQLLDQDYSWRRPNRRYLSQGAYLPSLMDDDGGLEHLAYYFDTSASVTDPQVVRFNSEVKHIKESFRPQKLTLVQFDRRIQKETVYLEDDPFDCLEVQGRGGTSLVCVREHIIEHRPTAVVVFSDLECAPMEKLPAGLNIPILWVCIDNEHAQVNEGQLIHIKE
jgi:predicted metal-dependent peptidase